MPPELSLVVDTVAAPEPIELLRSIDESTLPADRFEVLLQVSGAPESVEETWRRFASRRPNVRLVAPGELRWQDAGGDYVLRLEAGQRLFPDALTRLVDLAAAHDLDAVVGREVATGAALGGPLTDDVVDADAVAPELLAGPVVLRRRDSLESTGSTGADAGPARVGVLASYPATLRSEPLISSAAAVTVTAEPPVARWEGSALLLELAGQVEAADPATLRPVLVLRQLETELSYLLPGVAGDVAVGDEPVRWTTSASIDIGAAAAGMPLPSGEWRVEVALAGAAQSSAPIALSAVSIPVALLDERVVVVAPGPEFVLDVGPTRQPCQHVFEAKDATVTESAAGCRLDISLAGWHVTGDKPLPATVGLGRLRLPAQVVPAAGSATLTAFVSGLAGTYPLSLRLGRAPMHPTGLAVVISGSGAVTVSAAPPEAPSGGKASASGSRRPSGSGAPEAKRSPRPKPKKAPAKPAQRAVGPVAKLRRAVPSSWEPQVRRLARVPLFRKVYRRATGIGRD